MSIASHTRRRARARRGERGAALVEAAIVLPFLVLMLFGLAEYSMAERTSNHVAKTIRNSIVESQRTPTSVQADYRVLDTIREAVGTNGLDSVAWVMVYRGASTSTAPPTACVTAANALTSGTAGITNSCNIYSGAFMTGASASNFSDSTCPSTQADRFLCPATRRTVFATTDRIGVAVKYTHKWITKIVPGTGLTTTDYAVTLLAADPRPT